MKAQLISKSTVHCRRRELQGQSLASAANTDSCNAPIENSFKGPIPTPPPPQPRLNTPCLSPSLRQACRNRWGSRSNPWLSVMSPNEAFWDAVWVAKMSKEYGVGGVGRREHFRWAERGQATRRPENGPCAGGRGHTGSRSGPAYISGLFLCGLRELYIGWAHKESMWLRVLVGRPVCLGFPRASKPVPVQAVLLGPWPWLLTGPLATPLLHQPLSSFQRDPSLLPWDASSLDYVLVFVPLLPQNNQSPLRLRPGVLKSDHPGLLFGIRFWVALGVTQALVPRIRLARVTAAAPPGPDSQPPNASLVKTEK